MANEATIQSSLQIRLGNLNYNSSPINFRATVTGVKGPTPGQILANVAPGTDVNLSALVQPTLCRLQNLDTTNFVTVGVWDPDLTTFLPLLELMPGESYVVRLSRELGKEYGVGTGTIGSGISIRLISDTAACNCLVEAFEK